MEREWQFDADDLEAVRRHLLEQPFRPDGEIADRGEKLLDDRYLDTAGRRILQSGYALRIRRKGETFKATMKSLEGGTGDLRSREEYEEPLPDGRPESISLAPGPVGSRIRETASGESLGLLLALETRRHLLAIVAGETVLAEIALDRTTFTGEIEPGRESLVRVEVELKEGDERTVSPMVERLREECGLRPTRTSKLEAGLQAIGFVR